MLRISTSARLRSVMSTKIPWRKSLHFAMQSVKKFIPLRLRPHPTTMPTALRLNAFGLANIALESTTVPPLGPTHVHVRVRASSLNYRDLMVVLGQYNPKMQLPRILGSDAAGEVVAVGFAVQRFKPGERVCTLFFQDWLRGRIPP